MQRAEEEGPAEQQRDECALRAVQLKELKQRGDLANAELSQLKQAKSDTQDLLHENTLRLERTKQESVRLNGRIVRNPEEIKKV